MARAKRRKKFFEVKIPLIENQTQLLAYEPKELNNRIIRFDLTRILRGKGAIIQFKVKTEGEEISSIPQKIKIMPYFLKRVVRKGTNQVEDSLLTNCKNAQIRIKPFLVTRRKVSRVIRKTLRERAKKFLIEYTKDKTPEQLFEEILKNRLQKQLSSELKKIYPLSFCDIRVLEVEEENSSKQ